MIAALPAEDRLEFEETVRLYQEGMQGCVQGCTQPDEKFRKTCRAFGIIEQRDRNRFMLRLRLTAGRITAWQLLGAAETAQALGDGHLHLTSRQDIQLQGIALADIVTAVRQLVPYALVTSGEGNTVQNIASCDGCHLCHGSAFDVEPYARELSRKLHNDPESLDLPHKFKISLSSCPSDCAEAGLTDVGFIVCSSPTAKRADRAFQVLVGGSTSAGAGPTWELEASLPAAEGYLATAAIRNIYRKLAHENGDRDVSRPRTPGGMDADRSGGGGVKERLRSVIQRVGFKYFQALYSAEKENLREWLLWDIVPLDDSRGRREEPSWMPPGGGRDFLEWISAFTAPQLEYGFYTVTVPVAGGTIQSDAVASMAEFLWTNDLDEIRVTLAQNFLIANVPGRLMHALHAKLSAAGLASVLPKPLLHLTACSGKSICRLGVCRSQPLVWALLSRAGKSCWSHRALEQMRIHVSGCAVGCMRTAAATLGFEGAVETRDGESVPVYDVYWGGQSRGIASKVAQRVGRVDARQAPQLIDDILERLAIAVPEDAGFDEVLRLGHPIVEACVERLNGG